MKRTLQDGMLHGYQDLLIIVNAPPWRPKDYNSACVHCAYCITLYVACATLLRRLSHRDPVFPTNMQIDLLKPRYKYI